MDKRSGDRNLMSESSYKCIHCKDRKKLFCATHNDGRGFYEPCHFCMEFIDPTKLITNYKKLLEFVKKEITPTARKYVCTTNHAVLLDNAEQLLKEIGELNE